MSDNEQPLSPLPDVPARRPYDAPRLTSSASLEQVTLFSGTVVDGGVIFGEP